MKVIDKLELPSINWYDVQIGADVYSVRISCEHDIEIYKFEDGIEPEPIDENLRQEITTFINGYIVMENLIK